MVIGIFGESCTGKSTLAESLKQRLNARVYTGRDYLRLSKNETMAKALFRKELEGALNGEHILYVVSEMEHLSLLPEGALRVLVTAELDVIRQRFARRMGGNLPAPVAAMLERKHGCFDGEAHDFHVRSGRDDADELCREIERQINGGNHGQ